MNTYIAMLTSIAIWTMRTVLTADSITEILHHPNACRMSIADAVPELATAGVAASLRSRDFQAQVFGKTFANFLGQAVMYMACPKLGRIHNGHWRGSRHGHRQPDQGGKREAAQRGNFQPES